MDLRHSLAFCPEIPPSRVGAWVSAGVEVGDRETAPGTTRTSICVEGASHGPRREGEGEKKDWKGELHSRVLAVAVCMNIFNMF